MSFQRLSERVEGKSRPPGSRWKVVPLSRTGGRETPITEFVMCSWHKQLPRVIGIGPQWATTNIRQKATVVWQGAFRCILCNLVVSTHVTLWPFVCLSVRTRCSIIKGDEQIDLVLGMDVSFDQSYTVF